MLLCRPLEHDLLPNWKLTPSLQPILLPWKTYHRTKGAIVGAKSFNK